MNGAPSLARFGQAATASPRIGRRACVGCLIAASILVGALADRLLVESFTLQPVRDASYSAGVCSALDMAAAHGAIDSLSHQRILRSMTTVMNPEHETYAIRHRDLVEACARIRSRDGQRKY